MGRWQRMIAGAASGVEDRFDRLKDRLKGALGAGDPLQIVPYFGYGSQERLTIRGRVLEDEGILEATDDDSLWDNLLNMYRRIESDEIAFAQVKLTFQGESWEVTADEEGFFEFTFAPSQPLPAGQLWHQVEMALVWPEREGAPQVRATGHITVPPTGAELGVISDVDDTVVHSHATELLRMARLVFLGNARTRLPFSGVAAFYRALQGGSRGGANNPLFYVSSSPWNLYDLLLEFFRLREIPLAPFFLRDWGLTPQELLPTDHRDHKLLAICSLLDLYPDLPFILIGDSGQQDPEIYNEVVQRYPNRIAAVYIRDVSDDARDEEVGRLAEQVAAAESTLILAEDTMTMAQHAAAQGWIDARMVDQIAAEIAANREAPSGFEALLESEEEE